jgi:hypothetical protein
MGNLIVTVLPTSTIALPASVVQVSATEFRRGRGRPPIPATEVACMRKLRAAGHTLQQIAYFTERSMMTVFKYTASVPCHRRHNKAITINRRTGLAVVA